MKPFLLILSLLIATIPASAAIRERRGAPVLHSIVDTKGADAYMQPDERPFLPDHDVVTAKPTHGQMVMGYVCSAVGGSACLVGIYLMFANPALRNAGNDDVASGPSSLPLAIGLTTMGLAILVAGYLMLIDTHRGAPKKKKAL